MHFYKVTAVRKFFFFLDARRRGRIAIKEVLCSPILQELLDLRRPDLSADDLRSNWFSQESAAQVYDDYLTLDADQNGMLSASELARWRDGGLTSHFVARLFQEVNTYPNREDGMQNEMDYKLYLDFVLANMYKTILAPNPNPNPSPSPSASPSPGTRPPTRRWRTTSACSTCTRRGGSPSSRSTTSSAPSSSGCTR